MLVGLVGVKEKGGVAKEEDGPDGSNGRGNNIRFAKIVTNNSNASVLSSSKAFSFAFYFLEAEFQL